MELRPGLKLNSAVCTTEIIVVSTAGGDVDLTCGGVAMLGPTDQAPADASADGGLAAGTLLGKRYTDDDATIEVLCTKPGDGSIGIGKTALSVKDAKPLPASD